MLSKECKSKKRLDVPSSGGRAIAEQFLNIFNETLDNTGKSGIRIALRQELNNINMTAPSMFQLVSTFNDTWRFRAFLGFMNEVGLGTPREDLFAYTLYKSSAVDNDPRGQYLAGKCCIQPIYVGGALQEGFYWFARAAQQGYKHAQNEVAWCFENGIGTRKDPCKAVYWHKKAEASGIHSASYTLAINYKDGNGVLRDMHKSFLWLKRAKDTGFTVLSGTSHRGADFRHILQDI